MASERRVGKIQNLLREVTADIVARTVPFPDGLLVTVTRTAVSDDLYYATVFVSVLAPDAAAEHAALDQLHRATGAIQYALNRKLRMRPVPRITFDVDQGEKRRERIEKLLGEEGQSG